MLWEVRTKRQELDLVISLICLGMIELNGIVSQPNHSLHELWFPGILIYLEK